MTSEDSKDTLEQWAIGATHRPLVDLLPFLANVMEAMQAYLDDENATALGAISLPGEETIEGATPAELAHFFAILVTEFEKESVVLWRAAQQQGQDVLPGEEREDEARVRAAQLDTARNMLGFVVHELGDIPDGKRETSAVLAALKALNYWCGSFAARTEH